MGVDPYEEPSIVFDDPKAWDEWYFHRKQRDSGHPFEVAPGYYHLYVCQDKTESETGGYYLNLVGAHWCFREVVSAYFAIKDAGYPMPLILLRCWCHPMLKNSSESILKILLFMYNILEDVVWYAR